VGLTGDELIVDLVNKDTDKDGVLDWEETLWGTDPKNKDTNGQGLGDKKEIEKLKAENKEENGGETLDENNLTETDKFARELFATVSTLNQSGQIDQATVDKITSSLADRMQNSAPRKVYTLAQIKTNKETGDKAARAYNDALSALYKKTPITGDVISIFEKLSGEEDEVDINILSELDPIIRQTSLFIDGMTKISTPTFLVNEHLAMLNALERILENLSDVKLMNKDVIIALTGISQYEQNSTDLETAVTNLANKIDKELSN
jgi:hypothetical protein